ncbi:NERD domain-containing protein [Streptomyces sp. NBC_01142]|uniref:NERD domain-containing protein n=1 Tax=Streptomyces sp. NBC_01142 TaxID=2975865 RepID=UPI00225890D8|nr:nuclease-related domain-containing protein [Streptomyces sp. NBC_01142]MCX4819371.1 NERD domain-containing protein [Streptomyces sp. NBC_01142]
MTGLRVTPARGQGRDRLYVSLPVGRHVAWYDRDSGRVSLVHDRYRADVLAVLGPYLTGEVTVGPPAVPTSADLVRLSLHPDDDLAPNRPGEALHAELDHVRASPRLLRQDPRRAELAAQQLLGDALDRLEGAGWRILHAVPLPGADLIDHLAIGPGGVLAVHTLQARRMRVRVADPVVRVGRGRPEPQLRLTRRRAERATLALATAVRPVLAVVAPARLDVVPAPPDVRILRDDEVAALAGLGGVLKPADIDALYATARDRRTWLRA